MRKVNVPPRYPPEEGRYLRGNDFSPVAVVTILIHDQEKVPPGIEALVRAGVEAGAALSGTLQTENIGIEKLVCNVVANPNIRYLVICGPESPGHSTGEALKSLVKNGVDAARRIIGTRAPTPYLFNLPISFIERFRKQIRVIDLVNEGGPELVRKAVWSCYQEDPTEFNGYTLSDPGAFPGSPLVGRITWRVTHPEREPRTPGERKQVERLRALMEKVQERVAARRLEKDENRTTP